MRNMIPPLLISLLTVATVSYGQPVLQRNISLTMANAVATAAVKACRAKGFHVTATVVDLAGQIKSQMRDDGAGPHTVDSSRMKAYTAASMHNSTLVLQRSIQAHPEISYLQHINGLLMGGGGLPIRIGAEMIGAIGVGGTPRGETDDQCAAAGIAQITSHAR